MINFPYTLDQIKSDDYSQMNGWIQSQLQNEFATIAQIAEEFKISHQQQYNMIAANKIPGHVMIGKTHVYLMCVARQWFEEYVAKQIARISTKEVKKQKAENKMGRPKKVPGQYTYELFGNTYQTTEAIEVVQSKWRRYITDQYPAYFDENGKAIGAVILQQPPELQAALKEIMKVFNKLRSDRIK